MFWREHENFWQMFGEKMDRFILYTELLCDKKKKKMGGEEVLCEGSTFSVYCIVIAMVVNCKIK